MDITSVVAFVGELSMTVGTPRFGVGMHPLDLIALVVKPSLKRIPNVNVPILLAISRALETIETEGGFPIERSIGFTVTLVTPPESVEQYGLR